MWYDKGTMKKDDFPVSTPCGVRNRQCGYSCDKENRPFCHLSIFHNLKADDSYFAAEESPVWESVCVPSVVVDVPAVAAAEASAEAAFAFAAA